MPMSFIVTEKSSYPTFLHILMVRRHN